MMRFGHENLRVSALEASIRFYGEHFGLSVIKRLQGSDGAMAWLGYRGAPDFFLELTEGAAEPGNGHIAFVTDARDAWHEKHAAAGIIDKEVPALGIYFLHDPDGNRIEVMPTDALAALRAK